MFVKNIDERCVDHPINTDEANFIEESIACQQIENQENELPNIFAIQTQIAKNKKSVNSPYANHNFAILNSKDGEDNNETWQKVVAFAKDNLPLEGTLQAKTGGFTYVKVDDEYIHTLFPMLSLQEDGFHEPPYFRSKEAPGAHISVFYEDENIASKELGQTFHFELKKITLVHPAKGTSYAVLQVESPELEALRQRYDLSPKLHGHEFHISLAKKISHSGVPMEL